MRALSKSLVLWALAISTSCVQDPAHEGERAASVRAAREALGVTGGDVPLPVKLNTFGVPTLSWDGSYSELLLADALAECWATQTEPSSVGGTTDTDILLKDTAISMAAATCKACSNGALTGANALFCAWRESRIDPACNIDAATALPRGLTPPASRLLAETAAYQISTAATLGISGTEATTVRNRAQNDLAYAEVNLCIAQHLRQKLDTVQIAFASSGELEGLQKLVYERALTATYYYSLITKAFASTATAPTVINHADYYIGVFNRWVANASMTAAKATRIGQDFASAVGLLTEATRASADLIMRKPEAQGSFGTSASLGSGSLRGPRVDLLDLLYGGPDEMQKRGFVTDMSQPEVGVLLGLARKAGPIRLTITNDQINFISTRTALLNQVERHLRQIDCDAAGNTAPTCSDPPLYMKDYLVFKRFGITSDHSLALVRAITQAVTGNPNAPFTSNTRSIFPFSRWVPWAAPSNTPRFTGRAYAPPAYVKGLHSFTGNVNVAPSTGDIVLDGDFGVEPLAASDLQSENWLGLETLPPFDLVPVADYWLQGFAFRQAGWRVTPLYSREIGAVPALALAREALFQAGARPSGTRANDLYLAAQSAALELQSAIGTRQVTIRQRTSTTSNSAACTGCVTLRPLEEAITGGSRFRFHIHTVTRSGDPFNRVVMAPGVPQAATAAIYTDTQFRSPFNTNRSSLAAVTYTTPTTTTWPSGYVLQSSTSVPVWDTTSPYGILVALRTSAATPFKYSHVYSAGGLGVRGTGQSGPSAGFGAVVAFGGYLNEKAEKAWEFDPQNWAKPMYDAFGLRRDWAPTADASLQGGVDGQSSEHYFLQRAKEAADEATRSLQQAFDTLQAETRDQTALASADVRGSALFFNEIQALCGAAADRPNCVPEIQNFDTLALQAIPTCAADKEWCTRSVQGVRKMLNNLRLPLIYDVVNSILQRAPAFSDYEGGKYQQIMLRQWAAFHRLNNQVTAVLRNGTVLDEQQEAALTEVALAQAEFDLAEAEGAARYDVLIAEMAATTAERTAFQADIDALAEERLQAADLRGIKCSIGALEHSVQAAFSWPGQVIGDLDFVPTMNDAPPISWGGEGLDAAVDKTFNPGPIYSAYWECQAADKIFWRTLSRTADLERGINARMKALDSAARAIASSRSEVGPRIYVAMNRHWLALAREGAVTAQNMSSLSESLATLQDAKSELLQTMAEFKQATLDTQRAMARVALDYGLETYDIRARFGVRRRFHSYDLWRARALSENARRLALAARRAIESRYVVNLSELKAPEPFVNAPALWADEIYESDLKPPVSLGLEELTGGGGGVYVNKLKDYVTNLELFVNGYTIQRPTAEALSDAEVIQLPGPAPEVTTTFDDTTISYLEPTPGAWSFYCEATERWVKHPDGRVVTAESPDWNLDEVCDGEAPTRAKLSFWLDSWGRYLGHDTADAYGERHNVRWKLAAVNLVGSGIRNCELADDRNACYAEPFLRFRLQHVGPAWVTNYEQQWRSLAIPQAVVEGGKALAAEEWLDPVTKSFNDPLVGNVARSEFSGRPMGGSYELTLDLTRDVRVERIERIQLLVQTEYWVRQL